MQGRTFSEVTIVDYERRPIHDKGSDEWVTFAFRTWWWPFLRTATWFCHRSSKNHVWMDERGRLYESYQLRNALIRWCSENERIEEPRQPEAAVQKATVN